MPETLSTLIAVLIVGRALAINLSKPEWRINAFPLLTVAGFLRGLLDKEACLQHMGRDLRPGEVGCFLSHLEALETFLKTDEEDAVVIEDDVQLVASFLGALRLISEQVRSFPPGFTAVNLAPSYYKYSSIIFSENGRNLRCAHCFPMSTMGLFWSRAGAEAVLKDARPISMPYDNYLRHIFTGKNSGFSAEPKLLQHGGFCSQIVSSDSKQVLPTQHKFYFFVRLRRTLTEKVHAIGAYIMWQRTLKTAPFGFSGRRWNV